MDRVVQIFCELLGDVCIQGFIFFSHLFIHSLSVHPWISLHSFSPSLFHSLILFLSFIPFLSSPPTPPFNLCFEVRGWLQIRCNKNACNVSTPRSEERRV